MTALQIRSYRTHAKATLSGRIYYKVPRVDLDDELKNVKSMQKKPYNPACLGSSVLCILGPSEWNQFCM